jgi:IclR family KDG regulon transcriptional repressor
MILLIKSGDSMPKYWVPALERANAILTLLAQKPSQHRLIDFTNLLNINKSSMFSLLQTMETLGWIQKEKGDTYSLGPTMGAISASYFRQFHLLKAFHQEAPLSVERVEETIQLAMLDGSHIIYLAKEESNSPIRVASDPGMRFPAHATSLGKVMLSQFSYEKFRQLFSNSPLEVMTPYTITDLNQIWRQIEEANSQGYAYDEQEAVLGFNCVAAPIYNHVGQIIAAVSFTMLEVRWSERGELARTEIINLAQRLSRRAGFVLHNKE